MIGAALAREEFAEKLDITSRVVFVLLMMSKTSGERIVSFFSFAISLTSPDEVVLLMMVSVKSRFSSGSWAAY